MNLQPLEHHALFPLFTLKGDVVWDSGLKDGRSNDQVALGFIEDFIDFVEKQENKQE